MPPVPPSVLAHVQVTQGHRQHEGTFVRVVNVPMPGWLVARVRAAATAHGVTAPGALRSLAAGFLHHPDPQAVLDLLPSMPMRGKHAPRVRVNMPADLARDLHTVAMRHKVWKAPLLGGMALAWTSSPDDGHDVPPQDVADWLTR